MRLFEAMVVCVFFEEDKVSEHEQVYPLAEQRAHRTIREWREDERPRERLLTHGVKTLSDAELLAVLLGTGTKGVSALDAARDLLNRYGELHEMLSREVADLACVRGIGQVKAISLIAAFELSRRMVSSPFDAKKVIRCASDLASYYIPRLRGLRKESFRVLLLNAANQVFREVVVSEGSLNASIVHPREVFRSAISDAAASTILLHNHPSGNTEPSREDIAITRQLREAGKIIGIEVVDHLIIAGESYTSFAERGMM